MVLIRVLFPKSNESDVYVVLDQLPSGRVWREVDEDLANEPMVVESIISGQFNHPVCVVAFNIHESWAKDVTGDIGIRLLELAAGREIGAKARAFAERVTEKTATVIV